MHPTQLNILESLRQGDARKFSQLLSDVAETSDNLTYHLKRLVADGFVETATKGEYTLAQKGLMYLNNNLELNHDLFPTVSCMLELQRPDGQVLIMYKLKQPFLGSQHLPTFGVISDQSLQEQVDNFLSKYHITAGDVKFKCVHRERAQDVNGIYIFDKLFVVFCGTVTDFEEQIDDRQFLLAAKEGLIASPDVLPATKAVLRQGQIANYSEASTKAA